MKNWREMDILQSDLFNSDYLDSRDGVIDINYMRVPVTFLWFLISFLFIGLPALMLSDFVSVFFLIPAILITALLCWKMPVLGRKHVMYGLKGQMKYRAEFYYNCDEAERSFYPHNVEELFRIDINKLVGDDRYNLDHQLVGLENDILSRRKARAELLDIKPDIASTLKEIELAREGLQSDIQVYKELS